MDVMTSMHSQILGDMKIIIIKNNTYPGVNNISHAESIHLMESSDLTEKTASL